ncbi:MAG: DUF4430 domain-containing protein [Campylobacterales bacterium]|nr:DUF4430 domain-containing protein [Campylobacterales bacterium]
MKILLWFFALSLSVLANDIEVTILYGNGTPDKVVTTTYNEGSTALELLKQVSDIVTVKTGRFTFVRSIDGVTSKVGKFGWFYLIDGNSVKKMAEDYVLKNEKSMLWVYKVEACY